nr:MAG TPA: hypothetical protein [Caudoviricetes sp.]
MSLVSFLKKLGILHAFDTNDISRAETENVLWEQDKAAERLSVAVAQDRKSTNRLREIIRGMASNEEVRRQRDPYAALVHHMKSSSSISKPNGRGH